MSGKIVIGLEVELIEVLFFVYFGLLFLFLQSFFFKNVFYFVFIEIYFIYCKILC